MITDRIGNLLIPNGKGGQKFIPVHPVIAAVRRAIRGSRRG